MIDARVVLLSDDAETGRLWAHGLRQRQAEVVVVSSVEEALARWKAEAFDLVVVDIYAPQRDVVQICRRLRAEIINPILLFSYHTSEPDMLAAYEAGVDECVAKPLSPPLFLAKVAAWLRRSWSVPTESLECIQAGDWRLDPMKRQVSKQDGTLIRLTNLEFRLLHLLMLNEGKVVDSGLIVERVWGRSNQGDSALLKNVMYRLRRKIEPEPAHPHYLQTLSGKGYLFQATPTKP